MIHIDKLSFAYENQSIYSQFNAEATMPGIYGLFGRNGSGKSTLLKLMAGLLGADSGSIDILGFQPRKRQAEFLSQIYILPEEFHLPDLTVPKLAKVQAPFYPEFDAALFDECIEVFEVPTTQRFSKMSLGQKKKATIAFALATLTPILLMDEPTNGLDIVSRSNFKTLMTRAEQRNRITLISTHQARDLESIIDYIWFIDKGELLLSVSIAEINQALVMDVGSKKPEIDNIIYHEKIGQQFFWIARNISGAMGEANLEMLYKALNLKQADIIAAIHSAAQAQAKERL